MRTIPNELSKRFNTIEGRREMIELYKDSEASFFGVNEDGENVEVSISPNGIILETYQSNGWVRVNYYDEFGEREGETFHGRWYKGDKTNG